MEITVVSSLTPADERRVAGTLTRVLATMLDLLPVAYSIRIKTTSGKIFTRSHSRVDVPEPPARHLPERAAAMPPGPGQPQDRAVWMSRSTPRDPLSS